MRFYVWWFRFEWEIFAASFALNFVYIAFAASGMFNDLFKTFQMKNWGIIGDYLSKTYVGLSFQGIVRKKRRLNVKSEKTILNGPILLLLKVLKFVKV